MFAKSRFLTVMAFLSGVVMLLGSLVSCRRENADSLNLLLSHIGDDAASIFILRPVEILQSAGLKIVDGKPDLPSSVFDCPYLHPGDTAFIRTALQVEGIDRERMAIVRYNYPDCGAIMFVIKDKDAFTKSMSAMGINWVRRTDCYVFHSEPSRGFAIVAYKNMGWVMRDESVTKMITLLKNFLDRAEQYPLKQWKKDSLSTPVQIRFLQKMPEGVDFAYLQGNVALRGPVMDLNANFLSADGTKSLIATAEDVKYISRGAQYIHNDDNIAFVLTLPNSITPNWIASLIPGIGYEDLSMLNGRMAFSANLVAEPNDNYLDPSNYIATLALGVQKEKSGSTFDTIAKQLRAMDLSLSGTGRNLQVPITPRTNVRLFIEEDSIIVATTGTPEKNTNPMPIDAFRGKILYFTLNIRRSDPVMQFLGSPVGIKAALSVTPVDINCQVSFLDTDKPFLNDLFTLLSL